MSQDRSIEVKVGALILVSTGILVAFILIMGGVSFERTYAVFVDFDNPGGIQTGAPVRIAGVKVGKVAELKFMGGVIDPGTNRRSLVRAKLSIEQRVRDSVRQNADFYVTTQGVLGEQFLAIDPGTNDRPILAENSVVKGIDPPRLDLFLAKAFELLDTTVDGIRNNRELLSDLAVSTLALVKGVNSVVYDNKDRINRTVANLESLSTEMNDLTRAARSKYVDNPRIARTIENIDKITTELSRDAAPLLKDSKEAMANLNRASALVGSPEESEKMKKVVSQLSELAARANNAAAGAQSIVTHIKTGKGSVGALVMDEAVYDDLQELIRDLKHNPWKFFWKE